MLPESATERKTHPVTTGVLDYFPDAIAEVANASYVGNQQHHADKPLHWDKAKSTDEADCLVRHLMQRGTRDTDGVRHTAKVAWRALALLQRELDAEAPQEIRSQPTEAELKRMEDGLLVERALRRATPPLPDRPMITSFRNDIVYTEGHRC